MFNDENIIHYDTLSRPLKQTNPLEFRLVVRDFARGDVPREDSEWGTKIYSPFELHLHYTIKLLRNQDVMINFTDGKYI